MTDDQEPEWARELTAVSELTRLRTELQTQDNAGTSDPVFVVQARRPIYAIQFDDPDGVEFLDEEGELCDESDASRRVEFVFRWDFEAAFLTRAAADAYVVANKHNGHLRVYVASAHRNPQWKSLRKAILGAT